MKKTLEAVCGLLCASALFGIMVLTFLDVLGRKLVNNSIPGSLELTELMMVAVIFGALPLVSLRGEHVTFDSLDAHLPAALRRAQAVIVHLLCAAALLGLAWLMWQMGSQFTETGETTAQLRIVKAPFIYGMAVLCGVTGLVHLAQLARPPAEAAEGEGAAL
jgi:TRAP-type C4-dicarboxylate transport system permease small subunit